jgi:hypothetical protein
MIAALAIILAITGVVLIGAAIRMGKAKVPDAPALPERDARGRFVKRKS